MCRRRFALSVMIALVVACGGESPTAPAVAVGSVELTGATSAEVGTSAQLTAVAKDAAGGVLATPVTWTSSAPTIIAVSGTGVVTATRIGTGTITATAGSASANITFTSSLTPYTFNFAAGTNPNDMQTIRDGVQDAHAYHKTVFARQVQKPTTISSLLTATGGCAQGGAAAFTGSQTITFCVGNPGWTQPGPTLRQKITQHELFHVWQFEYKWLGNPTLAGAHWVIEGSAELMGFRGLDAKGLLPFSTAIGCQVKQVADFPPGLPPLANVETAQSFSTTIGPLYSQSMLAMDQLTTSGGGLTSLRAYTDAIAAGTAWSTAFQASFAMSTSAFYSQFPAYRAGQAVPPQYLCGG
jgi:hypothetical protein